MEQPPEVGLQGAVSLVSYTVIYGGSFDPPHLGHQLACVYLLEALGAESVWVIPAHTHAFDKELSPFADRVAMCERMAAFLGQRVRVDSIESEFEHGGRTWPLLCALKQRHPDRRFVLAIGADILSEREHWHRWADIEKSVPIVVIGRSGFDGFSSVDLPRISSTEIRDRIRQGKSLMGLVPKAVVDWISAKGLYGTGDGR